MPDARTLAELLATLLLAEDSRARSSAARIKLLGLWDEVIRLATVWRSLPRLRARVDELDVQLDPGQGEELRRRAELAAAQSTLVCYRAAQALEALAVAGIRAAAFKGVAAITSIYGGPGARMLSDADLIVHPDDVRPAITTLGHVGFTPDITISLEEWLKLMGQRVYPVHDFLDLVDDDGVKIDLHWRLGAPRPDALNIADMLARSRTAALAGREIRVVAGEDAVLLAVQHVIRDGMSARSAVKDLLDIQLWITHDQLPCNRTRLLEGASACGLDVSLAASLGVLARYRPHGGNAGYYADARARLGSRDRRTADRISDLFFFQLECGTASELLVGLSGMTPGTLGRFLVSRLRSTTSRTYRTHKYASAAPPAGGQLRTLFRDLLALTPRKLAMYRSLSLETRRCARSPRSLSNLSM